MAGSAILVDARLDHDDFGSKRSKIINVIDSNKLEHDDVVRKPLRTFRNHALGGDNPIRSSSGRHRAVVSGIIAAAFDVAAQDLRSPRRGRAKLALARQVAMYLAHVVLGLSLSDAGRLYRRDRTTAAHACRLVEDLRDEQHFDSLLTILEEAVQTEIVRRVAKDAVR